MPCGGQTSPRVRIPPSPLFREDQRLSAPLPEVVTQTNKREGDHRDADVAIGGEAAVVSFFGQGLVGPRNIVLVFGESAEGTGDEALLRARIAAGGADIAAAEKERAGRFQEQGPADNTAEALLPLADLAQELIEPAISRDHSIDFFAARRFRAK